VVAQLGGETTFAERQTTVPFLLSQRNCDVVKPQSTETEQQHRQLECGPMSNVMVALPNIGGALCSAPQSLADAHYLTAMQ